jgi:hypothetical protein
MYPLIIPHMSDERSFTLRQADQGARICPHRQRLEAIYARLAGLPTYKELAKHHESEHGCAKPDADNNAIAFHEAQSRQADRAARRRFVMLTTRLNPLWLLAAGGALGGLGILA